MAKRPYAPHGTCHCGHPLAMTVGGDLVCLQCGHGVAEPTPRTA